MPQGPYAALDIVEFWRDLNDHLIELANAVPESKLIWQPSPPEWSFFDIGLHIAYARHHWLTSAVQDGETTPPPPETRTHSELRAALSGSWDRLAHFLSDDARLARRYAPPADDPDYLDPERFDGHFIAFHRLVHDAHHRADMLGLMTNMGLEPPENRRRRPLL